KQFDRDDFAAFLALLPERAEGVRLRHALEVRHASFVNPEFVAMAREAGAAIVFADSADYPELADPTADFIYARLQQAQAKEPAGYPPGALDRWAGGVRQWAAGKQPADLRYAGKRGTSGASRDVFMFFINGAK